MSNILVTKWSCLEVHANTGVWLIISETKMSSKMNWKPAIQTAFSMNVSKYSSSLAMQVELSR